MGSAPFLRRAWTAYLGRPARREGPALVFGLDDASLTLVPVSALPALLPGECPSALPARAAAPPRPSPAARFSRRAATVPVWR